MSPPALLAVLAVHISAGLGAVVTRAVAMLSPKRPSRHPTFGLLYYRCLLVVTATMAVLSVARWREDYHLFVLGLLSISVATLGLSRVRQRPRDLRLHMIAFGLSYILLLTAFYVDNGRNLPLWDRLPSIAYWLRAIRQGYHARGRQRTAKTSGHGPRTVAAGNA